MTFESLLLVQGITLEKRSYYAAEVNVLTNIHNVQNDRFYLQRHLSREEWHHKSGNIALLLLETVEVEFGVCRIARFGKKDFWDLMIVSSE